MLYLKLGVSSGDQFYGPENKEMTFNVHRINNDADFNIRNNYFTNSSVEIFNESLLDPAFNNTFTANFTDTVQVGLDDTLDLVVGVLKLKLDPAFGQEIMDLDGTEVLTNNTEFLKIYKGLYVTTEGTDGSILNIDYSHFASTLILYKHIDTAISKYTFEMGQNAQHFTEFKHEYEGTGSDEFKAILVDTALANKKYFLQASGGYAINIKMPDLISIDDSLGVVPVNKAELIMPVDSNTSEGFAPGNQFFISRFDDEGNKVPIADQSSPVLGGVYDEIRNEYRFNITTHIQQFLNGNLSRPDVRIEINKQGSSPNRSILYGHNVDTTDGKKALLLRIYFSTLNN